MSAHERQIKSTVWRGKYLEKRARPKRVREMREMRFQIVFYYYYFSANRPAE